MLFIIRGNQCKHPHTISFRKCLGSAVSFLALLLLTTNASGSDTIQAMSYNLLNYGASNNTISYKTPRLKAILDHVQPDILGVNELVSNPVYALSVLEQVLGQDKDQSKCTGHYRIPSLLQR